MPPPADATSARAISSLSRALLATCLGVVILGAVATAILFLAPGASAVAPALTLLALGQLGGLAAAGLLGIALGSVVRAGAGRGTGTQGVRTATARASDAARAVAGVGRVMVAALVLAVTAWALADLSTLVGALTGALVSSQLAVLLIVVGRRLARAGDVGRRSP